MRWIPLLVLFAFSACNQKAETPADTIQNDSIAVKATAPTQPEIFNLIASKDSIATIDSLEVAKLDQPLRALAAFYAAMAGTDCDGEYCGLTTALGLGKQGSEAHKQLIKKYFPNDKVAQTVLAQDCYLRPSGASTFSEYTDLKMTRNRDSVSVDYTMMYYNRGEIDYTKGPDRYVFENGTFRKLSRNLWKHADQ